MQNSLSKYNPQSATFFFQSCLTLETKRQVCVEEQVQKYFGIIKNEQQRHEFMTLCIPYWIKSQEMDKN
jgi:hypothetical protein